MIENRPYAGTWRLNNRKVVKHTPDALVYVNGDLAVAGCPSCNGKIDIQKFITQVSVDPSTEGPATASISMHVPRTSGDGLFRDGEFLLRPGLEVHIYLRGYFPTQGLTAGVTPEQSGGVDVRSAMMYPYYLVFHGVVTDTSHEYSGGEHTATLSCTDLLHFWQYQRMSTNGAAFGARPTNSKVQMSLVGHNMTGMSPYAIIYQLFRDVQGSAGGVEFALGNKTNAAANSTVVGESLFSLSILYWEKRFAQATTSLRLYGADGTLYNAFQAAFLASLKSEDPVRLAKKYAGKNTQTLELDPLVRASRVSGFDPYSVGLGAEGGSNDGKIGINVAQLQAFTSDISQWGSVNFWESQYATKLEIANNVKEACGFEFYQDVDGDIVFKPPFYNLDTSSSRVYRIEDIDIISFSASTKEPEATVVKVTGGHFRGIIGFGLENNEWGTRAEFIDYRLVAQFGWRQQTFETKYHTDPQAMFFACVARFDIFNIGMNSATCTIPIRPELRPGYPVYIVSLDCFYYLHSFNHSFSYGGQCTTTLNLTGRRCKFYGPGQPPLDGTKATINDIRLNNMHLPRLPLEITEVDGEPLPVPRLQGFPNVVMTIDPELINPLTFAVGVAVDDLQTESSIQNLIDQVRSSRLAILQLQEDATNTDEKQRSIEGPFQLQTGNGTPPIPLPSVATLLKQAQSLQSLYSNKKASMADVERIQEDCAPLLALVEAARDTHARSFPTENSTATYLELLSDAKATFNPGASLPGYYRYYSSSHPSPEMQGPSSWVVDDTTGIITTGSVTPPENVTPTAQFVTTATGGTTMILDGNVYAGIPLAAPGSKDQAISTPTHEITTFQIARFTVLSEGTRSVTVTNRPTGFPVSSLASAMTTFNLARMQQVPVSTTSTVGDLYGGVFNIMAEKVQSAVGVLPEFPGPDRLLDDVAGVDTYSQISTLAGEMATSCAAVASRALMERQNAGEDVLTLARAWSSCWPSGAQVQGGGGKKKKKKAQEVVKTYNVPVFPVSDARGYEVIGTYRYGRGLTLESLNQLAGYTPITGADYATVEQFLGTIIDNRDALGLAVGSLSPELKAVLAAGTQSQDVINLINPGGTQTDISGMNSPADNREFTQKSTVVNAAYSMADMSLADSKRGVCACKGAEADTLLYAFGTEAFIQVSETEQVQGWLTEQMVGVAQDWEATQKAYRV